MQVRAQTSLKRIRLRLQGERVLAVEQRRAREIRQGALRLHDSLNEPNESKYEENDNPGSDHTDNTVHETYLDILRMNKGARALEMPLGARIAEIPGTALSLNKFTP